MHGINYLYFFVIVFLNNGCSATVTNDIRLSLMVSARYHKLEIKWSNVPDSAADGFIVLTTQKPHGKFTNATSTQSPPTSTLERSWDLSTQNNYDFTSSEVNSNRTYYKWYFSNGNDTEKYQALFYYGITSQNGWVTTNITFDRRLDRDIDVYTECYGYWISFVVKNGEIIASGCLRTYAQWMHNMKEKIENFRMRDLFIPGTHDSGSYRDDYEPRKNETLVTKYSITQDHDVKYQLLHGIRYLDLRVGYYSFLNIQFWANHGISKQQPLVNILKQIREFVLQSNEIVILDLQEFPVGFGRKLDVHRKLVEFIERELNDFIVRDMTWSTTLKDIWATNRNVIVAYDNSNIVTEYPGLFFRSVEHKWGNVQSLSELRVFLYKTTDSMTKSLSSRPQAAMAELTPHVWGVVTDQFGGLRVLADRVNKHVSSWYSEEWGSMTNIVAVDFYRGTNIVESAIYWNLKKSLLIPLRYDVL